MPPPSPVWYWDFKSKADETKIFQDAIFQLAVKIDGRWQMSSPAKLTILGVEKKKK